MKTFDQLEKSQRESAISIAYEDIRKGITNGILEIELVDAKNQADLTKILKSTVGKDPRIAELMISKNRNICKEIERLALVVAHESVYDNNGNILTEGKLDDYVLQH